MNFLKPRDECGSVLVGGLVLVFVITLVGLAVFDLSLSEPRLFADRQNKAQAVYTADAGLNVAWNEMANGATNTFATVWGNLAGTNIVPTGGGTHLLTAAPGGYQRDYQV